MSTLSSPAKKTVWVLKPISTENRDTDAPKEVCVKGNTSIGRNLECGITDPYLSKCQVLVSPIEGDESRVIVRHMGRSESVITPREGGSYATVILRDGREAFLNIGDKLSLLRGKYTYVLTKRAESISPAHSPDPSALSRSSSSGKLSLSRSELSELHDMVGLGESLSMTVKKKESSEAGEAPKADPGAAAGPEKMLALFFEDRDPKVIEAAVKLYKDPSLAAEMLLSKSDEEILSTSTDEPFIRLKDIFGEGTSDETINSALAACDFDVERAMNKILADREESALSERGGSDDKAVEVLRGMYPDTEESTLKEALDAAGGDTALAADFLNSALSVADKKKPRLMPDTMADGLAGEEWQRYAAGDPVAILRGKFPDVSESEIKKVLRDSGEDVDFAEKRLEAQTKSKHPPVSSSSSSSPPPPGHAKGGEEGGDKTARMISALKRDPGLSFLDDQTLREGLEATGFVSTELAKEWIKGDPAKKASLESAERMRKGAQKVKEVFPALDDASVTEALNKCGMNAESAISFLIEGRVPAPYASAPPPCSGKKGSKYAEDLKAMFPDKKYAEIEAALEAADQDVEVATDYLLKGMDPSQYALHTVKDIDYTKPCQSIQPRLRSSVEQLITPKTVAAANASYIKNNFALMLQREQMYFDNFFVFYHSYSHAHIIYELNSALAPLAYNVSSDFAPLPRLMLGPFADMPELSMLIEGFKGMKSKDHDSKYRSLAISVSTSLFSSSSEAPPTTVFTSGYSCTDLNFRSIIEMCLRNCNVPPQRVPSLTDAIINVGKKHGLDMSAYSGAGGMFAPYGGVGASSKNFGHMLQIFVRKDYIDDVAYSSHPYGVHTGKLLSDCLSRGDVNGQARIFMNPELFTDTTKTHIFYYCSNPQFFNKRKAFVQDLRNVLKELFENAENARKAMCGIKGINTV